MISCILSLRTQDKTTEAASRRLFQIARTPETLAKIPAGKIEKAIYTVGFYRVKAKRIREMSKEIATKIRRTGAGYHRRATAIERSRQKNRKFSGNRQLQPRGNLRGYPCSPDHEPVGLIKTKNHPDRICAAGSSPPKNTGSRSTVIWWLFARGSASRFHRFAPVPGGAKTSGESESKKTDNAHRQGGKGRKGKRGKELNEKTKGKLKEYSHLSHEESRKVESKGT